MLPSLGFFGSAAALVVAGWLGATVLALAAFFIALTPLDGAGIHGVAGGAGGNGGADLMAALTRRFYVALVIVIAAEVGGCALINALARRAP